MIDEKIKKILDTPLPNEAISKHPTKTYLKSIKPIYIIERLNDAFGVGSWKVKCKVITNNEGAPVVYVTLKIPDYNIELSQFGGNDNGGITNKNYDLGDAYKGAMTDGITKIASYLGIGAEVYKTVGTPSPNQNQNDKLWLNESMKKEWVNAEEKIRNGIIKPSDLRKYYRLSKNSMNHFMELEKNGGAGLRKSTNNF